MAFYGAKSSRILSTCHADIQLVLRRVLKIRDHSVICGVRTKLAQTKAFNSVPQTSKVSWPFSKHNITKSRPLSEAVDIVPWPEQYTDVPTMLVLAGIVIATADEMFSTGKISRPFRWGGDWDRDMDLNDQTFKDLWHFELANS